MKEQPETEWAHFFDQHAPEYEKNCFTKNTLQEVDFLVDVLGLSPGMRVLDVGCGSGRHAVELALRGLEVTGLDVSEGMLDQARHSAESRDAQVRWIESDAQSFSLSERFDAVICLCEGAFGLLGSADDPIGQAQAILNNIAESLKPGAQCLFTLLNAFALIRRQSQEHVQSGLFDPLSLAERSECHPRDMDQSEHSVLRERAFVPTEIVLLFALAGIEVTDIWGGTAGHWGRRTINLDEIEIMVVGRKVAERPKSPYRVFVEQ